MKATIKVINAGNCMICGREIKSVTKIFFCPKCKKQIANKDKPQAERATKNESNK